MPRKILLTALLALFIAPQSVFSQQIPAAAADAVQEMRNSDPLAAQAFTSAAQRGDLETARKIYADFKADRTGAVAKTASPRVPGPPSLFERTLSGDFPRDLLNQDLKQFGYDLFQKGNLPTEPSVNTPVGPDYIVGPGDQFTITLWGTAEGIFNLTVTKEGSVTLPKVGVVPVAGVRFGELEHSLRRHLSKYYSNFNISIAMGRIKTITVYVVGEVAEPGSYSLSSLATVYGALVSAGGPTKKGTLRTIQVLRNGRVIKTVDLYEFLLRGDRSQDARLQHEDTVFVPLIGPIVGLAGSVYRPAIYEFKGVETLGDALQTAGGIMPIGLGGRIQLRRFSDHEKQVVLDLTIPDSSPQGLKANPVMREKVLNMDVVRIFPVYDKIWETVSLEGGVRNPGEYQWREGMKLKEVIEQGQLLPTSDRRNAEIIRLTSDFMDRKVIPVDLDALMKGDESQNHLLMPKDGIRVYTTLRDVEKVVVRGEVLRPGEYDIHKGETLSEFLRRVGGFTREAYPYGAVFKRRDVKNAQAKNMQTFISRMQSQVLQSAAGGAATAVSSEEAAFAKSELQLNQGLLDNLKAMQEQLEGRVAININENIDTWAGSKDDLLLTDGDTLLIPKRPQEVVIIGEVHSPGAQVFVPGLLVKDYLSLTGGITNYADRDEIFVLQANGFAFSSDSPAVGNVEKVTVNPGDTVFVPQKVERYAAMRFTKDIIDILFKTAVTIATLTVIF